MEMYNDEDGATLRCVDDRVWRAIVAKVNFRNIVTFGDDEDALTTTGALINFGDLTTTGDLANGIFGAANNVSIKNFGAIDTSGSGAAGIFVQGEDARIDNFGSVTTHGGRLGDAFSEGIFAEGDRFAISNHGSVRVEGPGSSALVGVG